MEGGSNDSERLAFAYRRATAREPSPKEKDVLLTLLQQLAEDYRRQPDAARELLAVGDSPQNPNLDEQELASWTMVTSTILNLDETITKE